MTSFKDYLELIGLELHVGVKPNMQLLEEIVQAHLRTFPYQNIDLFVQGRKPASERVIPSLQIDSLYEQLVVKRHSGYCFQNSELLAWALTNLGFEVTKHLAKSINCLSQKVCEDALDALIISHELLIVKIASDEASQWIIDTGCGDNSLREPLFLHVGEQMLGSEMYRLSLTAKNGLRLEFKTPSGWFSLYELGLVPQSPAQIEEAHHQLFMSPRPPVIRELLRLGLVTGEKRKGIAYSLNGGPCFFKSRSSSQKHYDLVPLTPDTQFTRHILAVMINDENSLVYRVLDPYCPKTEKRTIAGIITPLDLQQKIGIEQTTTLFANLRETEMIQMLHPFLSSLLLITAERGHTHRREKQIASVDELCLLAEEKFGIILDEEVRAVLS